MSRFFIINKSRLLWFEFSSCYFTGLVGGGVELWAKPWTMRGWEKILLLPDSTCSAKLKMALGEIQDETQDAAGLERQIYYQC